MTYYVATSNSQKKVYHGDEDCHQLHQADNVREATEYHLDNLRPCKVCIKEEREEVDKTEWMSFTKNLRADPERVK